MMILTLLRSLVLGRTALALENLALRQQIAVLKRSAPRPRIRPRDRLFWVVLRRLWSGWRSSLHVVQPATVIAWHRQGWRIVWRLKSRSRSGRPPIPLEVRDLIRRLSRENRLWGSTRIQHELAHLGHDVAKSTVEKYMTRRHGPPSPRWRAFLREHASEILACDFFTIPTATFRSITGFVVMDLARRRILAIGATEHPSAEWTAGLLRRAVLAGGRAARFLIRDRDSIYGEAFRASCRGLGIAQIITAFEAPRQNAFVERLIGTIRRECLDHRIILSAAHAERVIQEFAVYYNEVRPHRALDGDAPIPRAPSGSGAGPVVAEPFLGGLHHGYRRAA